MKPFDYSVYGEAVGAALKANVKKLRRSAARGLRPPPRMSISEWAVKYRKFPDDAPYGVDWKHSTAPYLVEIMDALSPHDPCEEVIIMKCAQSGGTASVENWIGYISDFAPGPMLFVQATLKAALEWSSEKLWPMIEASKRLDPQRGGTIKALGAADGKGSNQHKLRFARSGGYVILAGGNSAPSLRSRTVRYAVEDDLDQFPDDLNKQGSPEVMVDQRLKVYRRRGLSKRCKISTPTIKGASKIEAAHKTSDRRRYYLKCPHCGWRFDCDWADVKWNDDPADAHVVPPCCGLKDGAIIEHWQKEAMSLTDGWLSDVIDGEPSPRILSEDSFQALRARMVPSRRRGFHITGEVTTFQTWGDMAVNFIGAQGDVNKLRGWTNLDRGYTFELKGSVPDYEKLRELKEQDWDRNRLPYGPAATTIGVDVQGDGVYLEKVGHAENGETWSIDARFIPGATDVKGEGAWLDLDKYCRTPVVYPGGKAFPVDQICVDAGFNTEAATAFCGSHPNRLPVFGRAGWTLPILGRGENLRYEKQGSRAGHASKKAEDKAYLVGTYGAKLAWYGFLRSTLKAAEEELATGVAVQSRGRCHFNRDAPDEWFEQVTAKTIVVKVVNGYPKRVWEPMPGRQNHWLDCRVYNLAAAEKLMLDSLGEADWAYRRAERYAPKDPAQGDLLALASMSSAPPQALRETVSQDAAAEPFVDPGEDYL